MTRARSGGRDEFPGPVDLLAIRRSGELIDAVAERRVAPAGPESGTAREPETVILLLQALAADVDRDIPATCATPARPVTRRARTGRGLKVRRTRRRRRAHTLIALSVSATLFTTTGVAAAGGFMSRAHQEAETKKTSGLIERSESPRKDPGTVQRSGRAEGGVTAPGERRNTGSGRTTARPSRAAGEETPGVGSLNDERQDQTGGRDGADDRTEREDRERTP